MTNWRCLFGFHQMGPDFSHNLYENDNGTKMMEWNQRCLKCGRIRHWKAEVREEDYQRKKNEVIV